MKTKFIKINSYNDLGKYSDDFSRVCIDNSSQVYSIPGYYYYINLIEYDGNLFIEITRDYKHRYHFIYKLSVDSYIKQAEKFGFILNSIDKYFTRPKDFSDKQEIIFIEELLNINVGNNYIANKYGLK